MLKAKQIYMPKNIDEALACLQNEDAIPLSAGTDIVPALRDGILSDISLVDLHHLNELNYIDYHDGCMHIGAMATHADISRHPDIQTKIPALAYACGLVGSAQIRNRATIGGNIGNASPAADSVPVLVAARSQVVLQTKKEKQTMLLSDFLVAPRRTKLPKGGLITEVIIPVPDGGWQGGYYKVGGRTSLTIAIVSCALLYDEKFGCRVAYGSMSPRIKREPLIEQFLLDNKTASKNELDKIAAESLAPISDVRAASEYRLAVAANLLWQGWYELKQSRTCYE